MTINGGHNIMNGIDANQGIPFEFFKAMCISGNQYTGHVQDFGYVYWVSRQVPLRLPDNIPVMAQAKITYITVSEMKVMPYAKPNFSHLAQPQYDFQNGFSKDINNKKQEQTEYQRFLGLMSSLLTTVNVANSTRGIVSTYNSASTIPVTLGSEYMIINKGGTRVHNPNRVYTTKGKIATALGRKLFYTGIVIDAALVCTGKQTIKKAAVNTAINAGILIIGGFCPPFGVVLGVSYLIISLGEYEWKQSIGSYTDIHGSPAPADNTRVFNPYR